MLKNRSYFSCCLLRFFTLLLLGNVLLSMVGVMALNIVIVDHVRVRTESKEAREIRRKIDEVIVKLQKDILLKESKLRDEYNDLISGKISRDDGEYEKKRQAFREKLEKLQILSRNNKKKVEIAYNTAMSGFTNKFTDILLKFQRDNKIDIILKKDNTLLHRQELDRTDELLKLINENYTKVSIDLEKMANDHGESDSGR